MKKNKNSDEEIIDIEKYNEIKACNVIGNAKKK
jgi:hypothetical protein